MPKLLMDWKQFRAKWLFRTKNFDMSNLQTTRLARCIGLMELTALGTGSMLGAGIYVVAPDAAKSHSGPALFLSFIIAGVASLFSGLCYAELGARIPRAGSAYVYSYVSVGELWAFIVGWNLILEYVIGAASVARAAVTYIDVLANGALTALFTRTMPIGIDFLGQYFDPLAFGMTMLLAILLAIGVRESTFINNILVILNIGITGYIIFVGPFYVDTSYWNMSQEEVMINSNSTSFGTGGFMPYGFGGVMTAASAAFYAFIGFDCIATTGEEVANPHRNIPLSIMLSLALCTVAYVGQSIVFTMMVPYYDMSSGTLLANVPYGSTIVASAALLGVVTNLLGLMFPMPRVIYAMAEDGLLFGFLAKVNSIFKTPLIATLLAGLLTAIFAAVFDVSQLVNMLSIGTLTAYSLVAASVLILRYREAFIDTPTPATKSVHGKESDDEDDDGKNSTKPHRPNVNNSVGTSSQQLVDDDDGPLTPGLPAPTMKNYLKAAISFKRYSKRANNFTASVAIILTVAISVSVLLMVLFVMIQTTLVAWPTYWPLVFIIIFGLIATVLSFRLWLLPQNTNFKTFKVPFVPLVPVLALSVNFYLLVSLDVNTWIRFGVWMGLGFFIYVFYGLWASKVRLENSSKVVAEEVRKNDSDSSSIYESCRAEPGQQPADQYS